MKILPNAVHLVLATSVALQVWTAAAQSPSTNDLWDVSQGATVVGHSSFDAADGLTINPYDARDIFGGHFGNYAPEQHWYGGVVFNDLAPADRLHFVEWRTPSPVTIRSFNLFATGDNPYHQWREFASFTLKAKSPDSDAFDLILFSYTPPHPFAFVDDQSALLVSVDIPAVTARDFRAEFANYPDQGLSGPRILELDGFADTRGTRNGDHQPPKVTIALANVEICWNSTSSLKYQVQYRSNTTTNLWVNLAATVLGNGSTNCVTDSVLGGSQRFYRVLEVP